MKKLIVFIALIGLPLVLVAQKQSLKIGIQSGFYQGTNYQAIKEGKNLSFVVSHFISDKLLISTHVNYGHNRFFREQNMNIITAINADGTNSDLSNIHIGLMLGYRLPIMKRLHLTGQLGLSTYTETTRYPHQNDENSLGYYQSSFTDLAFPVRLELGFEVYKGIEIELIGGCYIEPDYPIVGWHIGPQLSYKF